MDFLSKISANIFYLATLQEDVLSFGKQVAEKLDSLDRLGSEKLEQYGGSIINYIYGNFNLNKIFAWIPHHIISSILIFSVVFVLVKKLNSKRDKIGFFLKNITQDINKVSMTVSRLSSLSKEELDYMTGVIEEITNDLRYVKYEMYNTNTSVEKYQKEIKNIDIITADMSNRIKTGKAAEKLIPKISQLKKIISSYSLI